MVTKTTRKTIDLETALQYLFMCHRLPKRSFFFRGKPFYICARCTGILVGYFLSVVTFIIWGIFPIGVSVALLLPLVLDGGIQYVSPYESTNWRRLVTGLLSGVATIHILALLAALGMEHGEKFVGLFLK